MKSEPFCIVMEAPAALSTNMEVYCPACREEHSAVMQNRFTHAGTSGLCVCARPTCSSSRPCTLTVNILLLLSSPTIISSELQRKTQKYTEINHLDVDGGFGEIFWSSSPISERNPFLRGKEFHPKEDEGTLKMRQANQNSSANTMVLPCIHCSLLARSVCKLAFVSIVSWFVRY